MIKKIIAVRHIVESNRWVVWCEGESGSEGYRVVPTENVSPKFGIKVGDYLRIDPEGNHRVVININLSWSDFVFETELDNVAIRSIN